MNEYPFSFHTPTNTVTTIRDIVYKRKNWGTGSDVEDEEDAIACLCNMVELSMERAFKIGLILGSGSEKDINWKS